MWALDSEHFGNIPTYLDNLVQIEFNAFIRASEKLSQNTVDVDSGHSKGISQFLVVFDNTII